MKLYKNIIILGLPLLTTTSCVDDVMQKYEVEKPESIAQYEYLNSYDVLKSYVDRSKYPNLKLGIAIAAADYVKKEGVFELVNSNFEEMTAGNAMKYASCVNDEGVMNFTTVMNFVEAAREAGTTIYGHTLAWHAQQNNKYLNGLIADKAIPIKPGQEEEVEDKFVDYSKFTKFPFHVMGYTPVFEDGCMVSRYPGEWYQYFVADNIPTTIGKSYKVTFKIKASASGSMKVQFGNWGSLLVQPLGFSDEWQEVSITYDNCLVENSFIVVQPETFEGDIYIKSLKVSHSEAPSVSIEETVAEYNFDDGKTIGGWGNGLVISAEDGAMKVETPNSLNPWEVQLCHETTTPFEVGTKYYLKLKIKGDHEAGINAAFQNPDGYKGCGDFTGISVTEEWTEVETQATCTGEGATRLLINIGNYAGTLYMDDLRLYIKETSNTIPLTPEEKKDTLTWAMDKWIDGMMKACEGYVTVWDAVNEAISGSDKDGDGYYDLQSATRGTVSAEDAVNNFYWQDYLGDEGYVQTVVRLARQRFEENGGNPSALKLFINDYNLESDWDDNKKLKSLIHWIECWESDGITKIDGIGSQMHISCYEDPATQESKKNHIVKMLELLKKSGKLVKISELDMGYVDKEGNSVKTEDITFEQHKEMAELYKFVVSKYLEIIPVEQQYGITQWCVTDSPADSGWRGGEPVGLWDLNYNRKPAYGGFADGLKGVE